MTITRRNFVRISGIAGFSAALLGPVGKVFGQAESGSGLFAVPAESLADPLNYLVRAHFEPFTGTAFRASLGDGPRADFRLKAVSELTLPINVKQGFRGESFSLIFEGRSGKRRAEGSYLFDHGNLGQFTLHLVPVGKAGRNYEAVINRVDR